MQTGEVVAGRFYLEKSVAAGGTGSIFRAIDLVSDQTVALEGMHGGEHADRFEREARVLSELQHPAIVRYVAHGPTGHGEMFLAMEWLEGEDLAHRLKRAEITTEEA